MAKTFYVRTGLIGGTSDDLDGINGASLLADDACFVPLSGSNFWYFYELDSTSGSAESSPDIISPDSNAGNKRWLLQGVRAQDIQTTSGVTVGADLIVNDRINLIGGQIAFPATAVPSADPNTMDDYEEGTFTPSVYDAITAGNKSATDGTGTYTKTGDRVDASIKIENIDTTGLTGGNIAYIRTLPFTVDVIDSNGVVRTSNITFAGNYLVATASSLAVRMLNITTAAGSSSLTVVAIADDTGDILMTIRYGV